MATGLTTRPGTKPKLNETQEIIRTTQLRKKIYPNLTLENVDNYQYKRLLDPLKKNAGNIQRYQELFLDNMQAAEGVLSNVALRNFSYDKAKNSANTPSDMGRFNSLERQIDVVNTANGGSLGKPSLDKLFAAKNQSEFQSRMADTNIVQLPYSKDRTFASRAQRVFDYIVRFRAKHVKQLKHDVIQHYLEDVFSASADKTDEKIENSGIIRADLLSDFQKSKIVKAKAEYDAYKKRLKRDLMLEKDMKKERETFLSKPIEYAKSGEHYVAEKIQKMRDHWAGMDGKEKMIAGLTILVGTAFFLNSENEGIQKTRDALMKAGLIALGYVGINTTSKVLFGKSISHMAGNYIEDKSGKRDFLKNSFNTNKEGADNIQTSLVVLGNHDFMELADLYVKEKATNKLDKLRGIPVGGVAENEMSQQTIYKVMALLDKKLGKNNSSIEKILIELKNAQADARRKGKAFIPPTWSMIMTAVLQNQKLGWEYDKTGKLRAKPRKSNLETVWETTDKNRTKKWWPLTGLPKDWEKQLVDNKPVEAANGSQLKKLSSTIIPTSEPLGNIISPSNFGRFTKGFNALYVDSYRKKPTNTFHSFTDTGEHAMYITSKTKVDKQTHRSKPAARIAAVQGAYQQALKRLKDRISAKTNHPLKNYKDRLNEFVHPVFGTFIGTGKSAKEYVMFLRLVLPDSDEFKLRDNHEWPNGNMMQNAKEKQLKSSDTLKRADFKTLADRKKAFKGAYESFLARVKLTKKQETEIDKILVFYSRKFAGSGMTKNGLIRYLATHNFTEAEIRKARGMAAGEKLPNDKIDIYAGIKEITLKTKINLPKNINRARILSTLGHLVVLACNGDKDAIASVTRIDKTLGDAIKANIKLKGTTFSMITIHYAVLLKKVYNNKPGLGEAGKRAAYQGLINQEVKKYFALS